MQEMRVIAVGVDPREAHPVLLLQETTGLRRVLPVSVGLPEATAIERERQHVVAPRPLSHQLIGEVLDAFGRRLERVRITALRDGIFYAELVLDRDATVSARVSDAVALALHLDVPIHAEDPVLDEAALAGVEVIDPTADDPAEGPAVAAGDPPVVATEEIEEFRRFLDNASPEDFDPT